MISTYDFREDYSVHGNYHKKTDMLQTTTISCVLIIYSQGVLCRGTKPTLFPADRKENQSTRDTVTSHWLSVTECFLLSTQFPSPEWKHMVEKLYLESWREEEQMEDTVFITAFFFTLRHMTNSLWNFKHWVTRLNWEPSIHLIHFQPWNLSPEVITVHSLEHMHF